MATPAQAMAAARAAKVAELAAAARSVDPPKPPQPPPPAWAGQSPPSEVSPKEAAARWYERTGGVEKAIASSQEALRRDLPPAEYGLYGNWSASDAEKTVPVRVVPQAELGPNIGGRWYRTGAGYSAVELGDAAPGLHPTNMEHETVHAMTLPVRKIGEASGGHVVPSAKQIDATVDATRQANIARASAENAQPEMVDNIRSYYDRNRPFYHYLSTPIELDPTVAEVRRRYEFATGIPVRSIDDARAAWDWWTTTGRRAEWEPHNRPSRGAVEWNFYSRLPEDAKNILIRRMPQVFAVPAAVAAGAAAQQEQPSVLDGLRSK